MWTRDRRGEENPTGTPTTAATTVRLREPSPESMRTISAAIVVTTVSLATAYGTCTGSSSQLPTSQCEAWQDLWTETGGPEWTYCNDAKFKLDPCACGVVGCSKKHI